MTDAAPTPPTAPGEEPSIEEILASIRKIISDEPNAEGAEGQTPAPPMDDMPLPPGAEAKPAQAPTQASPEQIDNPQETNVSGLDTPAPVVEDEILDLSAFAEESPSMSEQPADATAESFAAPNHPTVEKDQAADDGNMAFDLGLEDSSMSEMTPLDTPMDDAKSAVAGDGLVSDKSASVATAAMAKLAAAADPTPTETQLWVGARTIEQVVEDLMRPMLKAWLDQNLPRLVERLVEKELARMARRATE